MRTGVASGCWLLLLAGLLIGCGDEGARRAEGAGDPPAPVLPPPVPAASAHADIGIEDVATRTERWRKSVGSFLDRGPSGGTWRVKGPCLDLMWSFAPHPEHPEAVLAARIDPMGDVIAVRPVNRASLPRIFFESPAWLFFDNYEMVGSPVLDPLEEEAQAVRLTWRRKGSDEDDQSARRVWFDPDGTVLRVEDVSRTGFPLRLVERVSADTGGWDPTGVPDDVMAMEAKPPAVYADDMRRALAAPFSIYEPQTLPPGFVLVRADYVAVDLAEGLEVRRATLLYVDGLALISIVIAPTPDMNSILAHYSQMDNQQNADPCPGLPDEPYRAGPPQSGRIRMHTEAARTVLRRDGLGEDGDVSLMVLGRNELHVETYLDLIEKLREVSREDRAPRDLDK